MKRILTNKPEQLSGDPGSGQPEAPRPSASEDPYRQLAAQLAHLHESLEALYAERTLLQERQIQLEAHHRATGRLMFEARHDSAASDQLESKLAETERRAAVNQATLDGLSEQLGGWERELHSLLSPACFTFGRLLSALKQSVLELARATIEALVAPELSPEDRAHTEALACRSKLFAGLGDIQLPSGGNWSFARPLDRTAEDQAARADTMVHVMRETSRLLTATERIFREVGAHSVPLPEFVLGELPEPAQPFAGDLPPPPLMPLEFGDLEDGERSFIEELCAAGGKQIEQLTDSDLCVLANSLNSYRESRGRSALNRMAMGN